MGKINVTVPRQIEGRDKKGKKWTIKPGNHEFTEGQAKKLEGLYFPNEEQVANANNTDSNTNNSENEVAVKAEEKTTSTNNTHSNANNSENEVAAEAEEKTASTNNTD